MSKQTFNLEVSDHCYTLLSGMYKLNIHDRTVPGIIQC